MKKVPISRICALYEEGVYKFYSEQAFLLLKYHGIHSGGSHWPFTQPFFFLLDFSTHIHFSVPFHPVCLGNSKFCFCNMQSKSTPAPNPITHKPVKSQVT